MGRVSVWAAWQKLKRAEELSVWGFFGEGLRSLYKVLDWRWVSGANKEVLTKFWTLMFFKVLTAGQLGRGILSGTCCEM